MGSCCSASCCGDGQQVPVAVGGLGAVPLAQQQPVQRTLADFAGVTQCAVAAAGSVLVGVNERLIRVGTNFYGDNDMFCPIEERFYFNTYFGATTWIIAEAYKPRDQRAFYLNQAVSTQLGLARAHDLTLPAAVNPTGHPTLLIIKNVQNEDTQGWMNGELGGSGRSGPLDTARFMAETVFGKTVTRILADIGGGAHATQVDATGDPHIYITIA